MSLSPRYSRAFLFVFLAAALSAHAQIVGGTIAGVVHDSSGAAVSGATVTVRQTETGATRTLTTDAEGRFFAPSVPVGPYTVAVQQDGFAPQRQTGITLTVGQSLQLKFVLGVAAVEQEVEVDAAGSRREHYHAANRRAGRRAPGEGAAAERPQLRRAAHAESAPPSTTPASAPAASALRTLRSATCSLSAAAARRTISFC